MSQSSFAPADLPFPSPSSIHRSAVSHGRQGVLGRCRRQRHLPRVHLRVPLLLPHRGTRVETDGTQDLRPVRRRVQAVDADDTAVGDLARGDAAHAGGIRRGDIRGCHPDGLRVRHRRRRGDGRTRDRDECSFLGGA